MFVFPNYLGNGMTLEVFYWWIIIDYFQRLKLLPLQNLVLVFFSFFFLLAHNPPTNSDFSLWWLIEWVREGELKKTMHFVLQNLCSNLSGCIRLRPKWCPTILSPFRTKQLIGHTYISWSAGSFETSVGRSYLWEFRVKRKLIQVLWKL